MKPKQSLRLLNDLPYAQEKVSSDASLFAQLAMSTARKNNLSTKQMMDELETKGEKKIILL